MALNWKVELRIRDDPEDKTLPNLNQKGMNALIEKCIQVINREYEGVEVIDSNAFIEPIKTWNIKSESIPHRVYRVTLGIRDEEEEFKCTCADYYYYFINGECKHIKKVKKQLAGERQETKLLFTEGQQ